MKPKNFLKLGVEILLMAIKAIKKNQEEDYDYSCEHICIEPRKRHGWQNK